MARTFQKSSLAGKDGTLFVFHIPGWGELSFSERVRERPARAFHVCMAVALPRAIRQNKQAAPVLSERSRLVTSGLAACEGEASWSLVWSAYSSLLDTKGA